MHRWFFLAAVGLATTGCRGNLSAPCAVDIPEPTATSAQVTGVVYEDRNRNRIRDADEAGVPGVQVSNGEVVVVTDDAGRYVLPALEEMSVFVTKPRNYAVPISSEGVPQFFYIHRPGGSPDAIRKYRGWSPTGPLPASLDFPLEPSPSPDRFRMLALGDTQVRTDTHVSYLRDSLLPSVTALDRKPAFAVALGDLVDNTLSLYPRYRRIMGRLGFPTFYVPGNHDLNFDAPDDRYSLETYTKFFGPPYYSFDYGQVHFVVLDSVVLTGDSPRDYRGQLDGKQLRWLQEDLARVSDDTLVVISMHIPLVCWIDRRKTNGRGMVCNRQQLYDLLAGRKVLLLAGHTHTIEHFVPGQREERWGAPTPFTQIIAGAVAGSWWDGHAGPRGVPMAYQRDGAPRGFMVFDFDGTTYRPRYQPTTPAGPDMHIAWAQEDRSPVAPGLVSSSGGTRVVANIWAAPTDAEVWVEISGHRIDAARTTGVADTLSAATQASLEDGRHMVDTTHLWTAPLPPLPPGLHDLKVLAKDRYGNLWHRSTVVEVHP